jgi:hypothetical protein
VPAVPFRLPLSATTDANGNATLTRIVSQSQWSSVALFAVAQLAAATQTTVSSNTLPVGSTTVTTPPTPPLWVVAAGGIPITPVGGTQGTQLSATSLLLAVAEPLTISVSGAAPHSTVQVTLSGLAADDPTSLFAPMLIQGLTPQIATPMTTVPAFDPASITSNSVAFAGGGPNQAIIGIPAGRIWHGTLWAAAAANSSAAGGISIFTNGATVVPASGTLLCVVDVDPSPSTGHLAVPDVYVAAGSSGAELDASCSHAFANVGAIGVLL